MNRQAQAAVLFLTGGAILHTGLTDLYLRYVKAGLRPLLLAAGVVLIATAVATVWYERRSVRAEAHAHREPRVAWLLVLPLLALVMVAPPALGSYSAMRTGTALQKQPWGFADLPASDTGKGTGTGKGTEIVRLSLVDYAGRAAYDHGRSLGNRRIRTAGLVALGSDGTPYLVRMALSCCAADAQPVKIGLTGRTPPVLRPDTWLEVTGTYTARQTRDPVNDGIIPFLDITEAKPVKAPRDPYDESWNG
ncbi:putative repeat protein (TIGR03943 family) [Streptomyces sp. V3I8]|uniref:TIGR03943 family putative permease subunit n=1 Tax=Streptomyces sp. V3I8 TaxID=3042279 RepID=UPI0027847D6D|nr:TIGR03943 family protein [Streptomyces sp. V3I8]MDQ1037799.1 putative repeat protein (TIGR03943 family) [Streptomyces sp. V3I8]